MTKLNDCACGGKMGVARTNKLESHTLRILLCSVCGKLDRTIEVQYNHEQHLAFLPQGVSIPSDTNVHVTVVGDTPIFNLDAKLAALGHTDDDDQ